MERRSWIGYLCAGALLWNGIPHLIVWATGRRNLTPFGPDSSPTTNLLWGALNLTGGYALVRAADRREGARREPGAWLLPFGVGGLFAATFGVLYEALRRRG